MPADLVVRSRRMVFQGEVRPASLVVADGRIVDILPLEATVSAAAVYDAGERAVLPGLVDTHVHVNEPGRTEWEGFESATRAAAAGGITTLVDMPLNAVPATTTAAALAAKVQAARGQVRVDVGFWGGVIPGNGAELGPLVEAGALGFKCFVVDSGVPEFPAASYDDIAAVLPGLKRLGLPLLVHAEDPEVIARNAAAFERGLPTDHATWLATRPPEAEVVAVTRLLELASGPRARLHIVHVAAAAVLPLLADARRRGVPVSAETCPHYLTFSAEEVPWGGTAFKCAPPLREAEHREALWQGLADGTLDLIASDHSPSPPAGKHLEDGRFDAAWGGIASLQLSLPVTWTEASRRGFGLVDLARWMAEAPARLAGLAGRKGVLAVGADADVTVVDTEATFNVDPRRLYHRHAVTPYAGRTLRGVVTTTFLAGRAVFLDGQLAPPSGRLILHAGRTGPQ